MLIRLLLMLKPFSLRRRFTRILDHGSMIVSTIPTRGDFWKHLTTRNFDLLLLSRSLLKEPSSQQIATIRDLPDRPEVIVISEEENPEDRATLLAAGCIAVVFTGLSDRVLLETLQTLVNRQKETALKILREERSEDRAHLNDFVSSSPAMQSFMGTVRRIVSSDSTLLITGETGVGKERLARAIHQESQRSTGPFIAINCGAIPETLLESELFGHEEGAFTGAIRAHRGSFELAHGGTIFLDEIGDMPIHLQVKLLRVLQEKKIFRLGSEHPVDVDVRVMAATNRDLSAEIESKRFRADLFYRLGVVTLVVPPLRERREDISALLDSYLEHFRFRLNRALSGISDEARAALVDYSWPGNVRELVNVMERAVLLSAGPQITIGDLPETITRRQRIKHPIPASPPPDVFQLPEHFLDRPLPEARRSVVQMFERKYLEHLLERAGGRIGFAARLAGINPRSLFQKMREHEIRKETFRNFDGLK